MKGKLSIIITTLMITSALVVFAVPAKAASEEDIEEAIEGGVAWLADQQLPDGSWLAYYYVYEAGTGLALYKLCERAYELGMESPFDESYEYRNNVVAGFDWLFDHLYVVSIENQDHTNGVTGTVDDPDTNGNENGVCARYDTTLETYSTGIVLAAVAASGTPDRVVNVPGSPVNGWTYGDVAQDMVDFLSFSQVDNTLGYGGYKEGGWDYKAVNNGVGGTGWKGDQSNSGYAMLGLAEAEDFGCTVPNWVKAELDWWIDWVQDDVNGDTNDGGSWYSYPGDSIGVNILKTGNLLFQMAFVGDTPTTPRVVDTLDYLTRHWNDPSGANSPPGWNGNPAQYQTMFCAMKGLEYMAIETFNGIDWFENFSDVIVAQQNTDNYWPSSSGRGEPVIITEWALLTLERVAPEPEPEIVVCEHDLFAGQHIRVGKINVWNDCENLYVKYIVDTDNWYLTEIHLDVDNSSGIRDGDDDVPQTRKGNPIPGRFAYSWENDQPLMTEHTMVLSLEGLSENILIAAHAVVENHYWDFEDSEMVLMKQDETAWAATAPGENRFVDRGNWATYVQCIVRPCPE